MYNICIIYAKKVYISIFIRLLEPQTGRLSNNYFCSFLSVETSIWTSDVEGVETDEKPMLKPMKNCRKPCFFCNCSIC